MAFTPKYHTKNLANIAKLADNTKAKATQWYNWCISNKIDIYIYETIRTLSTQKQYVHIGASQTLRSYHLVGQALDFVPIVNGKTNWNKYNNADIKKAVQKAKEIGFEWGGNWRTFRDAPHLQNNYRGYGTDRFTKAAPKTEVKAASTSKKKPSKLVYNGLLKSKSSGNSVKALQTALAYLGYSVGTIDGKFGDKCTKAVKAFQKKYKLTQDGIVGKSTINKINSLI